MLFLTAPQVKIEITDHSNNFKDDIFLSQEPNRQDCRDSLLGGGGAGGRGRGHKLLPLKELISWWNYGFEATMTTLPPY